VRALAFEEIRWQPADSTRLVLVEEPAETDSGAWWLRPRPMVDLQAVPDLREPFDLRGLSH